MPCILVGKILSLGYNLVFCFNCCMTCFNCYVLLTKKMAKNLLNKAEAVICMGQVVAWRSLLLLGMLFKVISAFLAVNFCWTQNPQANKQEYGTSLIIKAWLNLQQRLFSINHRRS